MESSGFNLPAGAKTDRQQSKPRLIYESRNGYCRIYSAEINGRRIALKALKPDYADSPVHIDLLRKEYEIGHTLYHPAIAATLGFQSFDGIGPAIIMEFVDGLTLREYLDNHGSFSKEKAMAVVEQMCDALTYLHSHQLIHRDLKPSNIMLTHDGRYVKIIDFGLSDGTAFTDFKYPGGTQHYSAPEQLDQGIDNDPRIDIFSLGIIMHEICPGAGGGYRRTARECCRRNPEQRPAQISEIIPLIRRYDTIKQSWLTAIAICIFIGSVWMSLYFVANRTHITAEKTTAANDLMTDTASISLPEQLSTDTSAVFSATPIAVGNSDAHNEHSEPILQESEQSTASPSLTLNEASLKCQEIIARRYADHLKLIDTLTTHRSSELASAGYWKHLSKQEFKKWLAGKEISEKSPVYEMLASMMQKAISDHEERNSYDESLHWQNASYPQIARVFSKDLGDGIIYTVTLQEDGTYIKEYTDVHAKRAREQIRRDMERIRDGESPY